MSIAAASRYTLLKTRHELIKGNTREHNKVRHLPHSVGIWLHGTRPVFYLATVAGCFSAAGMNGRSCGLR